MVKRSQGKECLVLFVAGLLFAMALPVGAAISVSASPPSLPADGISTSTITATLQSPQPGVTVYFSTELGSVNPTSSQTDQNGQARATLTASTTVGTTQVRAETVTDSGFRAVPFTRELNQAFSKDTRYWCATNAAYMAAKYAGYLGSIDDLEAKINTAELALGHNDHAGTCGCHCIWGVADGLALANVTNSGVSTATSVNEIARLAITANHCTYTRVWEYGGLHAVTMHGLKYMENFISHSAYCTHDPGPNPSHPGYAHENHYTMEWMDANFMSMPDPYPARYIEVYQYVP